jgi:hypothetical protein
MSPLLPHCVIGGHQEGSKQEFLPYRLGEIDEKQEIRGHSSTEVPTPQEQQRRDLNLHLHTAVIDHYPVVPEQSQTPTETEGLNKTLRLTIKLTIFRI